MNIFIQDSTKTDGSGLAGLLFNSAGLTAYYSFAGASATSTAITLATLSAVTSSWSSGGFKELDGTNMKGAYRLDLPNAVLAGSSGRSVLVYLSGATNMAPCVLEIELTATDNQDGVHFGLTSLPNDVPGSSAGLIRGQDLLTSTALVQAIFQDTTSGNYTVTGSSGKAIMDTVAMANKVTTMLELDPNSADPQNSLAASTYRFTAGTLRQQFKEIIDGMSAYDLFGQADFYTDSNTFGAAVIGAVTGVAYDPVNNYLFEAEGNNNRILVYNASPTSPNKTAIHVLGQTNFTNVSANEGSGSPTANSLKNPNGLWYDTATKFLWVADTGNHRVGYYDFSASISDHQALARVLGQANKTSGSANRGSTTGAGTLSSPSSVQTNATLGWVVVGDASNNRVCLWTAAITGDGQSANQFLGQSSSSGNSAGSTRTTLSQPTGVAIDPDNARIFVGDTGNARCMIWGSSTVTNAQADNVLGQPDFTTHNTGRRTRAGLYSPGANLSYDNERNWLIIPEIGNSRVTIWDVSPATLTNGPLALYVLNQTSFVDAETALTPNHTLVANNAVTQDKANDRIFVGEQLSSGGRIKIYQLHNYLRRNQANDFPNMTEPGSGSVNVNGNMVAGISHIYAQAFNERDQTALVKTVKNRAGAAIWTATISNDGSTCVHGQLG